MDIASSMGDLSQFMYFFGAVYLGTPLIAGYGEAAFNGLQRRRENCKEALEFPEQSQPLGVLDNALEDLRMALDAPEVKPSLSMLLFLSLVHVGLAIVFASVSSMAVPSVLALAVMIAIAALYGGIALRGVQQVLNAERAAVRAARNVETSLR